MRKGIIDCYTLLEVVAIVEWSILQIYKTYGSVDNNEKVQIDFKGDQYMIKGR